MTEKKTILIIEDETPLREALIEKFSRAGFAVVSAADGPEGLEIALDKHPDCILLDILLPKMNGVAVAKELRQNAWGKDVPIVILTNVNEAPEVAEALEAGVFDYLVKTNRSLDEVVGKVREKLGVK